MDKEHVYVFELQNNKWYIGYSKNIGNRIKRHNKKEATAWTTLHPVIKLVETVNGTCAVENHKLWSYMSTYGIDNVRGGIFAAVELSCDQYNFAQCMINGELTVAKVLYPNIWVTYMRSIHNQCYKCGNGEHTASTCTEPQNFNHDKSHGGDGCSLCMSDDGYRLYYFEDDLGIGYMYVGDDVTISCPGCSPGFGITALESLKFCVEHKLPWQNKFSQLLDDSDDINLEVVKYACENGYIMTPQLTEVFAKHDNYECLKYACDNGCSLSAKAENILKEREQTI